MRDPSEGLTDEGTITTGARRDRIDVAFEPVVKAAIKMIEQLGHENRSDPAALYIYGSVATGCARVPQSDVDLLTVGIAPDAAKRIADTLSRRFITVCRGVEMAVSSIEDFEGGDDEAYGGRIFLKHYCVQLWGTALFSADAPYPGDARAAKAFNGDIAKAYQRWRIDAAHQPPEQLGRGIARKTLLAVASLVSVHDGIWTTDRASSASRWSQLNPALEEDLVRLCVWSENGAAVSAADVDAILAPRALVDVIVGQFDRMIGLW